MSLVPQFKIGLWNGWGSMLLYVLIVYLLPTFINRKAARKMFSFPQYSNKKEKIFGYTAMVIYFVSFIYTIFLPLKLGTVLFYAGLFVYLLGMLATIMGLLSYIKTPLEKPVTKGIYCISRNPLYLGYLLVCIGISISCISWVFLIYSIISAILIHILITPEEKFCLDNYGDAYREYMKRTSKWIGIPR